MDGLELKGTFREQGKIHGEAYRKEIHEIASIRQHLIRSFLKTFSLWDLEKFYAKQVQALSQFPELFEEFCGIAEGARIGLNELMVLNNYTDMRDFLKCDPNDEGCSVFYFKNNKATVAGQTWDMHGSATEYVRYLRTQHEGVDCTIFTVTGCLALAGVNSFGVGVLVNNLHSLECDVHGLMWPGLVKLILLKAKDRMEAKSILDLHMPASGHNYIIYDSNGAFNIETTGKQWDISSSVENGADGYVFHTNHYTGKLKAFENAERKSSTTEGRWAALENVFSNTYENLDFSLAKEELFVRGAAATICIPASKDKPNASATCGGLIYDLKAKKLELFKGLYTNGDLKSFML